MSEMISDIYAENVEKYNIPVVVSEDSKALVESLNSTKKVKRKTMRLVISSIQQSMREGKISDIKHVSSDTQLADVFTKKGAKAELLLKVLNCGNLSICKKKH